MGRYLNWYLAGAVVLSAILCDCAFSHKARAADFPICRAPRYAQLDSTTKEDVEGHNKFHDAYETWMRNDTHTSCCNMRIMSLDGKTVVSGDCRPVEAELRRDKKGELHWWAQREKGDPRDVWVRIPERIIVREKNPDLSGDSAHLCATASTLYCFVGSTGTN